MPGRWSEARASVLVVFLAGLGTPTLAQTGSEVTLHGFGGWAGAWTDNDNTFGRVATDDFELNSYYFALNVSARPSPKLSVNAQMKWATDTLGQELDLDYGFAQWSVSPALALRVGKIKSPFGLYTEILDVGTLRPFYLLPQGMYSAPSLVAESFVGVGLGGTTSLGREWELSFDWQDETPPASRIFPGRPASLDEHRGVGAALNFWASPQLVVKANYYHVTGNLFAHPEKSLTHLFSGKTIERKTSVLVLGAQYSS